MMDMINVLGIETSCDETAVGVVSDGHVLRSNIIASQIEIHAQYGGIVPELASRQHIRDISATVSSSLKTAGINMEDIDIVSATYGPGLAGSLITGLNTAKALAMSLGVPFIGSNHLEGHLYASWLKESGELPDTEPGFPLACLIASGGHTDLILMENHGNYKLVGRTRDDAAGEAFDKAARVLGLGFPGGPEIQKAAEQMIGENDLELPRAWMKGTLDFSFSGVKTALLHMAQNKGIYPLDQCQFTDDQVRLLVNQMSYAFQEAVVDVMVEKVVSMAEQYHAKGILIGGGVAANSRLRTKVVDRSNIPVLIPPPVLCTDNGAMIAACAYYQYQRGEQYGFELDVNPSLPLG